MRGLFIIFLLSSFWGFSQDTHIYVLLETGDYESLSAEILNMNESAINSINKQAYLGALYCKRADFQKLPKDKLADFKEGAKLLENSISAQPDNPEFRFLRYIIQTKAPRFLGYHDNITEDKTYLEKNEGDISKGLRKVIKEFSAANLALSIDV